MTFSTQNIGIDIDNKDDAKQLLRLLRILKIKGQYRLSSSHRGYHFNLSTAKCNKKEQLLIRYMLNDCYGRWIGDVRRFKHGIKTFNVLFDHKKGKRSGQWRKI